MVSKKIKRVFLDYDKIKEFDQLLLTLVEKSRGNVRYRKKVEFSDEKGRIFEIDSIHEIKGRRIYELSFGIADGSSYINLSGHGSCVFLYAHLGDDPSDLSHIMRRSESFLTSKCRGYTWYLRQSIGMMAYGLILGLFILGLSVLRGQDLATVSLLVLMVEYLPIAFFGSFIVTITILASGIMGRYGRTSEVFDGRTKREIFKNFTRIAAGLITLIAGPLVVNLISKLLHLT